MCFEGRSIILRPILTPFDLHVSKRHIFCVFAVDANCVVSVETFTLIQFFRWGGRLRHISFKYVSRTRIIPATLPMSFLVDCNLYIVENDVLYRTCLPAVDINTVFTVAEDIAEGNIT